MQIFPKYTAGSEYQDESSSSSSVSCPHTTMRSILKKTLHDLIVYHLCVKNSTCSMVSHLLV